MPPPKTPPSLEGFKAKPRKSLHQEASFVSSQANTLSSARQLLDSKLSSAPRWPGGVSSPILNSQRSQMGGRRAGEASPYAEERGPGTGLAAAFQTQLVPETWGWKMSHSTLSPSPNPCLLDGLISGQHSSQHPRALRKEGGKE